MGVERAVTRWYLQRQLLLHQVSAKTTVSASDTPPVAAQTAGGVGGANAQNGEGQDSVTHLGPCPKPMMG